MKKINMLLAVLALTAVSCQKSMDTPQGTDTGVPVTLSVSISTPDTKLAYTEDTGLKAAWKAGDKLSVVSLDAGGKMLFNDVFSTTGSGSTADFTGSFRGTEAASVKIFYPALTAGNETDGYYSATPSGTYPSDYLSPVLNHCIKGNEYIYYGGGYKIINAINTPCTNLTYYTVMYGDADVDKLKSDGTLDVSLKHASAMLKIKFTLPDGVAGCKVVSVGINSYLSDNTTMNPFAVGYCKYVNLPRFNGGSRNGYSFALGSSSDENEKGDGIQLGTGVKEFTVYVPVQFNSGVSKTFSAGDYFKFSVRDSGSSVYSTKMAFGSAKTLEAGKMYTVDATLTKE